MPVSAPLKKSYRKNSFLYIIGKYICSQPHKDMNIFLENLKDELEPFINPAKDEKSVKTASSNRINLKYDLLRAIELYSNTVGKPIYFEPEMYLDDEIKSACLVYILDLNSLTTTTLYRMGLPVGFTRNADAVNMKTGLLYEDRPLVMNSRHLIDFKFGKSHPGSLFLMLKSFLTDLDSYFLLMFPNKDKTCFIAIPDCETMRNYFLSKTDSLSKRISYTGDDVRTSILQLLKL